MVKKIEEEKSSVPGGDISIKTPEIKKDVVEIKREDFDAMLKQLEKQAKDIELLYKTADKNRIAKELNKEGENLIKQAKVRTLDNTGKLIVGWSDLIINKCEVVMGRWVEDQTVNVVIEGGEVINMSYLESVRRTNQKVLADIIGTNQTEEDGVIKTILKLQLPTGKVLLLDKVFTN